MRVWTFKNKKTIKAMKKGTSTNLINLSIRPIADHLDELKYPCRILKWKMTWINWSDWDNDVAYSIWIKLCPHWYLGCQLAVIWDTVHVFTLLNPLWQFPDHIRLTMTSEEKVHEYFPRCKLSVSLTQFESLTATLNSKWHLKTVHLTQVIVTKTVKAPKETFYQASTNCCCWKDAKLQE